MEAAAQPNAIEVTSDAPESVTASPTSAETSSESSESVNGTVDTTTDSERDENGRYLSREAANYRRRLRDTEAERDQLRERVDELQREQVEQIASKAGMAVPSDLWSTGTEIANLRDDDGRIEADTVQALVADVLSSRPTWRGPVGKIGVGVGASAVSRARTRPIGLSDLLKP